MAVVRLNADLKRASIGSFLLPLGLLPSSETAPHQGYTIAYNTGDDDEPETYTIQVVISHDQLPTLVDRALRLLPEEVVAILEIDSQDAYRTTDVFLSEEPISRSNFIENWQCYAPFLLEDCSIGVGANSEEPFLEIFLDPFKTLNFHIPLEMRDVLENMLSDLGLEEVPYTWPIDECESMIRGWRIRPVLDRSDPNLADEVELLNHLQHAWRLTLDIDPDHNVDEVGRELGFTLWHVQMLVESAFGAPVNEAVFALWVTADSLSRVEHYMQSTLADHPQWQLVRVESIDRVAFDDRPEHLSDIPPRRDHEEVHLVEIETIRDTHESPPDSTEVNRG